MIMPPLLKIIFEETNIENDEEISEELQHTTEMLDNILPKYVGV